MDGLRLPLGSISRNNGTRAVQGHEKVRRRHRERESHGSDDDDDESYEHKYDDGDEEQDGAIRHHMNGISLDLPMVTPREPPSTARAETGADQGQSRKKGARADLDLAPKKKRRTQLKFDELEAQVPLTARELGTSPLLKGRGGYVPDERKSKNVLFTPR